MLDDRRLEDVKLGEQRVAMDAAALVARRAARRSQLLKLGQKREVHAERARDLRPDVRPARAVAADVHLLQRDHVRVQAAQRLDDAGELIAALDVPLDEADAGARRRRRRRAARRRGAVVALGDLARRRESRGVGGIHRGPRAARQRRAERWKWRLSERAANDDAAAAAAAGAAASPERAEP